jgi:hypothetical protein
MGRLRYSDRMQLAETGSLGDLAHETVPGPLQVAIRSLVENAAAARQLQGSIETACVQHFGLSQDWFGFFHSSDVRAFVDAVEILAEQASKMYFVDRRNRVAIPYVDDRLNALFERHRFGYRVRDHLVERIGSPALSETVVGPALLAVQRPGWEEVERNFREAVIHQRGGETDDAITSANAAVESALKALGMSGQSLGQLSKSFRGSGLVPGYLGGVPELLDGLLNRLNAARSTDGDAHGKAPGAAVVPQALADLAVHWAGAFLVYLAATVA